MFRSSMLSAPAHIPAITVSSFGTGFAAPDLIRDVLIDTFSAMISGSLVCSASPSSGTNPASDTRLSSSNRAEPAVNLWETRTESASLPLGRSVRRNTILPAQKALSSFTRRHSTSSVCGSRLRKDDLMKFDDETMRRILDATFGAVEADVAVEAELGPLV